MAATPHGAAERGVEGPAIGMAEEHDLLAPLVAEEFLMVVNLHRIERVVRAEQ